MIHVKFDQILTWIKYTDEDPPHYVDRFFHVWKLVEAWNSKISTNFIPGWIYCREKLMMIWTNKVGPDWVVLPSKPHPFGGKCNTIFCAMSVVVFFVKILEGKDQQKEIGNP